MIDIRVLEKLIPDGSINVEKARAGRVPVLVVTPAGGAHGAPGILWIHGGGYATGMKEMVYVSRAAELVRKYGAVVISPGYRLSWLKPYPAALLDCYEGLRYLKAHADELGVDQDKIMVGGESAGGGLAAALCMYARDRGEIKVSFQMPLYPMLSNLDTISSRNNHGRNWNTRKNHLAWKLYLRRSAKKNVSPYASPSRQKDYSGLPPAYTFVGDGEPFYQETLDYVKSLNNAAVAASCDVYHTDLHAFDLLEPGLEISKQAAAEFEKKFCAAAGLEYAGSDA